MAKLELPHFLRVTQTLALVSGLMVPAGLATIEGCGGVVPSDSDKTEAGAYDGDVLGRMGIATMTDGGGLGTAPITDGGALGKKPVEASTYDGAIVGDQAIDAGESD